MILADLHCHSTHSDGSATPARLADFAQRRGLTHLALTDHDTLSGAEALTREAALRGVMVLPGAECTCADRSRGRAVHLLCYAPAHPGQLQAFMDVTLERRRAAKLEMFEKIQALYPMLRLEDVLYHSRLSASIHEVHLIQPLADMGYTSTVCGELFERLIGKHGSCYVPIEYHDVWRTAEVIREVGGKAVLAHPGQFDSMALALELCRRGLLDGIECYHPRNDAAITADCEALARRFGLIRTGGTDFHGCHARSPHPLGSFTTEAAELDRLLAPSRKMPYNNK